MKKMSSKALTLILLSLLLSSNAIADDKRAMLKPSDADAPMNIIREASRAYKALHDTAPGIPSSVTSKAQCVAVVPKAVTAAVVVGGTHGNGTVTCKNNGRWSAPAFVDLVNGSVGAQVGGKSSDVVLYFTNASAVEALKKGKIEFGADASVVAGNFERAFDTGTAGVVAYENTSGAYVGATLNGGKLAIDEDSNRAYYGKPTNLRDILEGKAGTSAGSATDAADSLISQLPI